MNLVVGQRKDECTTMQLIDGLFHKFTPAQDLLQQAFDADTGNAADLNVFDVLQQLDWIDPETVREVYSAYKPEIDDKQLPLNGAFNFILRRTAQALANESYVHELPYFLRQFNLD
jgi:hypothetical protein